MKKLPTGIPSFKKIRDGNYLYIDKTKQILKLTESGDSFFLSRPRRFGKSLLLDTLDALFRGEKELFKGLYIYDKWDWQIKYPVIRLDMSGDALTSKILINTLFDGVNLSAFSEKIDLKSNTAAGQFAELIIKLEEKYKQKVVILIDEYDKPILDHLDAMKDTKTSIGNKKVLSSFYSTMKTYNGHLHFVF
ncbi:MAG: AAA family ATPase, partial [Elusimicrobiota bacterium]|nr:AAA family ATPase [Elusimicrobiota bacterium]